MSTSLKFFLCLTLTCLLISTTAKNAPQNSLPSKTLPTIQTISRNDNFTHVCDPQWYANFGLDMTFFSFCDATLSYEERAKDLVDRMTLQEKVLQLGNKAYGVPRLGLPEYEWWSEALHGVSKLGPGTFFDNVVPAATSFPPVILTAASFNESLWKKIGQVVSTEARAMYNLGRAGLTFWSPNVNVARDPRWGRITETPGEDPYVVGVYASNYVRGLQDEVFPNKNNTILNTRPLKVSACCKHYAAYDVDNWLGVDRYKFDARVSEQDMVETFLRPFEMCIQDGDVSSVMCSYNRVNGLPTCANPELLSSTIRGDWKLNGYIVSDCDSIEVIVHRQKWLGDTNEDAVAQVLNAGLDLDCGEYYTNFASNAVIQGKAREQHIDRSLRYLYVVLMRLGYFDGSPQYKSLGKDDICTKENIELAAEAAREGIVLLKNVNEALPLNSTFKKIAVVGPHANASKVMIGNYEGIPCQYTTPIAGFSLYGEVIHAEGCDGVACNNESYIFPAMQAARVADATVVMVGLDLAFEAESLDRVDLLLPGYQTQLVQQVAQVSKGPVILVVMTAGGVDISFAKNNPKIGAILWAGYPGEEGGRAIADIVYGNYNPGGRLPLTWYEAEYVNMIPMTSMPLRPVDELSYPGRTYKFFNGSTVYPFGYGLSYTKFNYALTTSKKSIEIFPGKFQKCHDVSYKNDTYKPPCPAMLIDDLKQDMKIEFEVVIQNMGNRDGSEVVMVYSQPPEGIVGTPIKQVIGFKRVFVQAKSSQKINFVLDVCKSLGIVDYTSYKLLPLGWHTIVIGNNEVSFPFQVTLLS